MYQILLKEGYEYQIPEFKLFMEQITALFEKEDTKLSFSKYYVEYIVYCNEDSKIELFYNLVKNTKEPGLLNKFFKNDSEDVVLTEDEEYLQKLELLYSYLKTLYLESEVIEVDKMIDYSCCSIIYKYDSKSTDRYSDNYGGLNVKYDSEYDIKDFDKNISMYILNSMLPGTFISSKFYIYDDEYKVSMKVGSDKYNTSAVKGVCSTIQQITAQTQEYIDQNTNKKTKTDNKAKLHVQYKSSEDIFSTYSHSQFLNFLFVPYRFDKIMIVDPLISYLKDDEFSEGITIGKSAHPLQNGREIKISIDVIRKHFFGTGQPGSGKSAWLEMICKSVLEEREKGLNIGFSLFDPKANACIGVVNAIEKLANDGVIKDRKQFYSKVRYIDFSLDDCLFGINLLDKSVDVTFLINFFRDIFKSQGVQLERLISASVGALMYDTQNHTIEDVLKMFEDENYRFKVLKRLEGVKEAEMYIKEFRTEFKDEMINPIRNRIAPFVNDPRKRAIFNSENNLDQIMKWMEEGYIILYNTQNFSDLEVEMILGYIMLRYHLTAVQRKNNADPHLLLIDENSDVQIDVQDRIIAKDRSKGLHNGAITQYLEQLNKKLLDALTGAVTSKVILQQGVASSRRASEIISNEEVVISPKKLESLPTMTAYVATEDKEGNKKTLYVNIDPPYRYDAKGNIMEYSSSDRKLQNALHNREEELENILKNNMRENYPLNTTLGINKPNVQENESISKKIFSDDLFL